MPGYTDYLTTYSLCQWPPCNLHWSLWCSVFIISALGDSCIPTCIHMVTSLALWQSYTIWACEITMKHIHEMHQYYINSQQTAHFMYIPLFHSLHVCRPSRSCPCIVFRAQYASPPVLNLWTKLVNSFTILEQTGWKRSTWKSIVVAYLNSLCCMLEYMIST